MAEAHSAVRRGSSEKYSKFLPQKGERFMFIPGPKTIFTPKYAASSARAFPSSKRSSRFQVQAELEAVGKQVDLWLLFMSA